VGYGASFDSAAARPAQDEELFFVPSPMLLILSRDAEHRESKDARCRSSNIYR
jgi:hypothetical protein